MRALILLTLFVGCTSEYVQPDVLVHRRSDVLVLPHSELFLTGRAIHCEGACLVLEKEEKAWKVKYRKQIWWMKPLLEK